VTSESEPGVRKPSASPEIVTVTLPAVIAVVPESVMVPAPKFAVAV